MKYQPPYFGTVFGVLLVPFHYKSDRHPELNQTSNVSFHCNLPLGTPSYPAFVLMSMLTVLSGDWFFLISWTCLSPASSWVRLPATVREYEPALPPPPPNPLGRSADRRKYSLMISRFSSHFSLRYSLI